RLDRNDYKAESIYNLYASIAHYLIENSEIRPCKLWDSYCFGKMLRKFDEKMKQIQNAGLVNQDTNNYMSFEENDLDE
ncbi:20727_t:CDS:1, partial [Gigaspora rosea]